MTYVNKKYKLSYKNIHSKLLKYSPQENLLYLAQ